MGERSGPFDGLPWSAYLPPRTQFEIQALETAEFGWATAQAEGKDPPRLVRPEEVRVEERGEGSTARTVRAGLGCSAASAIGCTIVLSATSEPYVILSGGIATGSTGRAATWSRRLRVRRTVSLKARAVSLTFAPRDVPKINGLAM